MTQVLPPHNLAAERALLATILADPECLPDASEHVEAAHFYGRAEGTAFALMSKLEAEGKSLDIVAIVQASRAEGHEGFVNSLWLSELLDEPTARNAADCAKAVKTRFRQRQMLEALRRLAAEGADQSIDVDAWITRCEQTVYDLAQQVETQKPEDVTAVTSRVLETLNARTRGERDYVPTTLAPLNRIIQGWVPSKTHVIAGRPGNGKTAFILQEAINIAERFGAVAIGSFEMDRDELVERQLSQCGPVDNTKMLRGELDPSDWHRLGEAAARVNRLPIAILDKPSMSVAELAAGVRRQLTRLRRTFGNDLRLGAIVVDYVQLMEGPGETEEQVLARIVTTLRALGKATGAIILAVSQMNRESKMQSGAQRRPVMTDLRGSGQLEQDAHKIIFIHNPHSHLPEDEQTPERTMIVAKNRGGGTGDATVHFQGKFTRFVVPAHESHEWLDNVQEGLPFDNNPTHWNDP